jgi:hypothetical protein
VSTITNVFVQPYVYVYMTSTPDPIALPVMPHAPSVHGPTEPISMQFAGLLALYLTTVG